MKLSRFVQTTLLLLIATFFLQSCGGEDPYSVDYSQVPPAFNPSEAVQDSVLPNGVKIYVMKEGSGQFDVTYKDQVMVKYTGRTQEGKIFVSSYSRQRKKDTNFKTSLSNLYPYPIQTRFGRVQPLIKGLRKGLYGMVPGEKRIIVVPPEMAKGGRLRTRVDVEGKTLVYDVELVSIAGVPRDEF